MNDHHTTLSAKVVLAFNWLAAFLGIGTLVDAVNVGVGVVSAVWLVIQIANYFVYTRPINRARLAKALAGDLEACETDRGDLK